jgi:hypothetical protein
MKIIRLLFAAVLMLCFEVAVCQDSSVKGTVTDEMNTFVEDATVKLQGTAFTATTGKNGVFEITNVPFGNYTVEVTAENHTTYTQAVAIKDAVTELGFISMPVTGSVAEDSQDNIAVVSLSDSDIKETSTQTVSGVLNASRDAFNAATSFTFSAARFKIRGYDNENFVTFMNGIPMTDLTNGNSMFFLWGGLNDVVRNREGVTTLSPGSFSFSGIGGSSYIDSRATKQRKQLSASFAVSNRAYENRAMVTYGTGLLKGGWAFAGSISRRWSDEGYIPGTYYDGWSYFLAAEKIINSSHALSLTMFGAPTERGKSAPATKEMYDIAGTNYYNPTWGYQGGEKRNASVNTSHQPVAILQHDWKLNNQSSVKTAVGYSFGENVNTALDWYNAPDPRPDYYRNLPSYYSEFPLISSQIYQLLSSNEELRQIQWDQLYLANMNTIDTVKDVDGITGNIVTGHRSNYIVEERVQDSKKFHFNSFYNTNIGENVLFTAGLTYMKQKTDNFKRVKDLLGGDFYVDINQYAEQGFADSTNAIQNDVNHPNRILKEGDKFGYDYTSDINRTSGWMQAQLKYSKFDFFGAVELSETHFKRTGNVKNGLFQDNSFGDSEVQSFFNYAVKGGSTYKIDGRNYIFANASLLTRAPYFENSFVSVRTRNEYVDGLESENIFSTEGGYLMRAPKMKLRAVAYYTKFTDQTNTVSFYHSDYRNFVNYSLTNIDKTHTGVELAADYNIGHGFTVTAVAALGRYIYTSRPNATITVDNTSETVAENEVVFAKNFYVGGTPQEAVTLGINYRAKKFWFINLNVNYYNNTYIDFNPVRRTQLAVDVVEYNSDQWNKIIEQEKTEDSFTVDLFGGKSWKLNNYFSKLKKNTFLVLNVGISNIFNNTNQVTGGFEQLRFDFQDKNPDAFAPKYFYSLGTTYFVNLVLRMN